MADTSPQRRRQDCEAAGRPLYERALLPALVLIGLAAAIAGGWWLWQGSGTASLVRDGSPNWSHDGKSVIFSSEAGGKADLYEADRSGGNRREVLHTPGDEGGAAYSPDGQWVAFHSDLHGNFEIYVMRADGALVRRLTDHPAIDQAPAWSRDGRQIAFMSNRERQDADGDIDGEAGGPFDIFRMNADGTGLERLTTGGSHWFPQYSPDGAQLALHIERDAYVMSLSSRALRRVTHEPANGLYPTWSPDGLRIAFMSWRNGRSQIFTARADGSDPQAVVTMPSGDAVDPRWSPDGKYIAFVHVSEGGLTRPQAGSHQRIVYVVELDTRRLSRISR